MEILSKGPFKENICHTGPVVFQERKRACSLVGKFHYFYRGRYTERGPKLNFCFVFHTSFYIGQHVNIYFERFQLCYAQYFTFVRVLI